ncbi:hypothetical protein JDV09_09140 [Mycobacterium sp. Y57]|uniref:hypothetical protein n=1 Tax=Mycolicibacterium xanthum TaxID=2796469 RepID=UPI001C860FB7|nr:hypothetical protein [Mycolicibacterium xanthum]MBX7432269.1 hypothetical protein [Mycolicibacterium xanthum]
MNTITFTTTAVAAALGAAVLGLAAPAAAAPSAGGNADTTISQLEDQGNRVIVNRLSDAPLSQATVVGIQPGADLRGQVWSSDDDSIRQNVITGKVYYVDVK